MTRPLVVIGDVLLDIDVVGRSERLSPEAPVPVIHDAATHYRPGGAALAALLAARGARPVVLIAPLASDEAGDRIRGLLGDRVELVALPWTGSTPVKTRLRAGHHPVARLDSGGAAGVIGPLPDRAESAVAGAAGILVSDYGRGTTADERVRTLISAALAEVPVVWDPHPHGSPAVPGTSLVTPNEKELFGFVETASDGSLGSVRGAARELADRWRVPAVCVTIGARGALLYVGPDAPRMAPGTAVTATDTCGAGDSFAAAAATALADGALPSDAVARAVATASQFVGSGGAAAFSTNGWDGPEFSPAEAGTAQPKPNVDAELRRVRDTGGVVVATGGCFDLLHAGHVATLQAARALGDFLVVCLNSDESVRRLKGTQRPLQSAVDRARVLLGLRAVDAVVTFEEDTPTEVIRRVRPDIWVKGGDYSGMALPEASVLSEWGGEAVTVPYLTGRSTTALATLAAQSVTP